MITIMVQCSACRGIGIYHGFAEPAGVGVICLECKGKGSKTITFIPFIGRVLREDILTVRRSRGTFISTGIGPTGNSITYQDFLKGKNRNKYPYRT